MSYDPKKPKSLKNPIWSDHEFWCEQRVKFEADHRELAEKMFKRLADNEDTPCSPRVPKP